MKQFLPVCCLLLISFASNAADNYLLGARASALGNSAVTLSDVWASSHNQAALAELKNSSAGIFFDNRFLLSELSIKGFAFALPVKSSGVFSVSATYFGYNLYNEQKAGLAFAKKLGNKISIGIQLDYLSTYIADDYGSRSTFAAEAGILAEPFDKLKIGVHVFNPTSAKLAAYDDERIPVIFRLGMSYSFSEKVLLCAETEKDISYAASFKAGIEYHPVEQLYLRGGIASDPLLSSFGFGLKLKSFKLDFSSSFHQTLGFTPQLAITYDFTKP